jgi:glycosyltransferase involved in cell wall biosynthesis
VSVALDVRADIMMSVVESNRKVGKGEAKTTCPGNILLVANFDSDVGYAWWLMENYWAEIAHYYHQLGRTCVLIYPRVTTLPDRIAQSPIEVLEHDFEDRSEAGRRRLRSIVRDHNVRSVYFTDKKIFDSYYFRLRSWGIRKIVNHDHSPGERERANWLKRLLKTMIHKTRIFSADHYIGVSDFVRRRLIESGGVPAERCSYVLNGIVPIHVQAEYRQYAHGSFKLPKEATIVVSTGRATVYKGIDLLVECANILVNMKGEKNLYFLHCGDGPDLEKFRKLAANYRLGERFIFAGKRMDIREILQSCHIGIQVSLGEAFSLSILEYMSAGLATLAPDHCGNSEAINDGVDGILYPPGDIESVVEMIRRLSHDGLQRRRLGAAAIQAVHEKFDVKRANADLIGVLSDKL